MSSCRFLVLSLAVLSMAACSPQPSSANPAATPGPATAPVVDAPADNPRDATPANPQHVSTIQLGATMTAMTEVCGLSQPADADKALRGIKQEMAAAGVSDAETERVFREAYEAAKAKSASAPPAEIAKGCASLKQMGDPATIKKLNDLAAKAEAAAKG